MKDRGRHKKKKNVVRAAKSERFTGIYREEMRTEKKQYIRLFVKYSLTMSGNNDNIIYINF